MQPGDQGPAGGVDDVLGACRAGGDDRRDAFAVHRHIDPGAVDLGVADHKVGGHWCTIGCERASASE